MALEVPKVSEIDLDLSGHAYRVAGPSRSVESDARDGHDDVRARLQLDERRLQLRGVSHDLEAELHVAAGGHSAGHRPVDRVRHVDALHVVAIGADVVDVEAV